jgi:hypothetical protein
MASTTSQKTTFGQSHGAIGPKTVAAVQSINPKAKRASEYRHSEIKSATMKRVQEEYRAIRIERSNETTRRNKSYMTAVRAAAALRRRIREWRDRHDSVTEFQLPNLGGVHPWRADERASWAEHESKKGQ